MADGHVGKCKECNKIDVTKNRNKKIEYYRQYDRDRGMEEHRVSARKEYAKTDDGKLIIRRIKKKWSDNNPLKKRAHGLVAKALVAGTLVKEPCVSCGASSDITNGHHPDYSLPLHVVWLCPKCHKAEHARINKGKQRYF